MSDCNLELIRSALTAWVNEHIEAPVRRAFALSAVGDYIDARTAYKELQAGTISSYSIQGRSISKRNVNDIPLDSLYDSLLDYIPESVMPTGVKGNCTRRIDFSEVRYEPEGQN